MPPIIPLSASEISGNALCVFNQNKSTLVINSDMGVSSCCSKVFPRGVEITAMKRVVLLLDRE